MPLSKTLLLSVPGTIPVPGVGPFLLLLLLLPIPRRVGGPNPFLWTWPLSHYNVPIGPGTHR